MSDATLIALFCLIAADIGGDCTVYHSRVDGLLMPACKLSYAYGCFWPF